MRSTSSAGSLWYRRDAIDKKVTLYNKNSQNYAFRKFTDEIHTKEEFYRFAMIGDMPALIQTDELDNLPELNFDTPGTLTVYPKGYKGIYTVSNEAYKKDVNQLLSDLPQMISRAFLKSIDVAAAGFLDRYTDTTFMTTWDGLAIGSASHLTSGGTFSNILSGNPVLTYNSAQDALLALMQQTTWNNEPYEINGPVALMYPIALTNVAENIVKGGPNDQRYDTTDHEPNWVGAHISKLIQIPRSSSTTAWAIVDLANNPFKVVMGLDMEKHGPIYYQENDSWKTSVTGQFALATEKPQGIVFSSGAGS